MTQVIFHSAAGLGEYGVRATVEFDGSTGGGEAGTAVPIFRVTGSVAIKVACVCTESLTVSDGATISVGISGDTAAIIAVTTASLIAAGEIWHDAAPDSDIEDFSDGVKEHVIAGGADIFITPAVANVTDGTLVFLCGWTPITTDGSVIDAA